MICCFVSGLNGTSSPTSHDDEQEVISLVLTMNQLCWHIPACLMFAHEQVGNPSWTNFPIFQSCYVLLYNMVSYAKLYSNFLNHHPVVLW